ncbi:2'-5'-oligoadenylate synthase 1-like [Haliotis asinina]|uniref:2'-5'-oligoadenylate synthase 1-like n=1 Tax=Haliotis asinina TaxID=109174 RepID=UPI0035319993
MTRVNNKNKGLYRCKGCSKEFQNDFALFQHLTARQKRCLNTACFYCEYDENSPVRLSNHIKERHSVFECTFCKERFFLRTKFEEHTKNREGIVKSWKSGSLPGVSEWESYDELIERLTPDAVVYQECHRVKERLEWFMRHNTSYKQCHITMAGSIAKETPLRKADVDLILFMDKFTTIEKFIDTKKEIIERFQRHVENRDMNWAHGLRFQRRTPYSIQFELSVSGSSTLMDVDLLPAVHLLQSNCTFSERDALYTEMKCMPEMERKHCVPCLSELQVQFVKKVPDRLKQVIRIVKNWIKTIREEERCRTVRCYFCELVVIDYWLRDGSPHHKIDIEDYVKQVLYQLCFCQSLRIVWPDEYDFLKYRNEEDRPIVLDPANPYVNVAPNMKDASRVSERAMEMFHRYGTVKHSHLIPNHYTFQNMALTESPAATLQRPADTRIDIGDSGLNGVCAGDVALPSLTIPIRSSKPTSQEAGRCSWRCKCVAVLMLVTVAVVLGLIIWGINL